MKNKLIFSALFVFLGLYIFSCKKDNNTQSSETSNHPVQSVERDGGSSLVGSQTIGEVTEYMFTSDGSSGSSREGEAFCCDVNWVGFQNLPFPPFTAGFTFNFNRYNVPGASAYRHRYTVYRNDVLFWTGSFNDQGATNCPNFNVALVWPNGLGNCCGVFSITMELQYRIGSTWFTCDADHGEMNYFPQGCGWCE